MAKVHRARFLTEDEYWSLPATGRTLADYWTEWLPKMCSRMKAEGTLVQTLEDEGYRLADLQVDLMQDGYPEDAAWEVVKQDLYALPPEDLVDKKNEAEKLRKAALEHNQKMAADPAYRKKCEEIGKRLDKYLPSFGNDTDDQMATPASAREIHKATGDKTEWDFIPKNAAWQCVGCKKHIPRTVTCKAHPKGIPAEITSGKATCKDREKKEELTKAEKAGVEALAAECHEELVKGVPPAVISPVCNQCAKRVPGAKCSEYPKGIPNTILLKEQECRKFQQK